MAKEKRPQFVTAVGRAIWPHVHAPDKKFKKEFGEYRTKIALSEEDAQEIIARIDSGVKEVFATAKAKFLKDSPGKSFEKTKQGKIMDNPYQEGDGDDAGTVIFNFKSPAGGIRKEDKTEWHRSIPVYDAKGKPLPKGTRIGSGSEIKVAYTLNPFSTPLGTGMSLRLEAVQVLKLVEFGDRDAKSFGFGEEEGFSVNETETEVPFSDETETEGADAPASGSDF